MKKTLLTILSFALLSGIAMANTTANTNDKEILTLGEGFTYPLPEGTVLECYAKNMNGKVKPFREYNDYYIVKNGELYSNTFHKFYKPKKADVLKKVDRVKLQEDKPILSLYDSLWEWSARRHQRHVVISTETGEYMMKAKQDNLIWYRTIKTSGYCRAVYPSSSL